MAALQRRCLTLHLHLSHPPRPHTLLTHASRSSPRPYHSAAHASPAPYPPLESALLTAALPHIPAHGFSSAALALGAKDAGYTAVAAAAALPRGPADLVLFWLASRRAKLAGVVDGEGEGLRKRWDEGGLGVGGRVRALVQERLRMNAVAGVVPRWTEVRLLSLVEVV